MNPTEIDITAFLFLLLRWFVVFFIFYLVVLTVLRGSNYYRIKRCPNCSGELKRAQRNGGDKMVRTLSFGILPVKRYRCYTCYWEGRSFDIKSSKGKSRSKGSNEEEDW